MSISSQKPSPPRQKKSNDPARTEERYALAMQSINYAVYDADLEGGEVYFSKALRDMLGMKPDDPAYTTGNIIETIHPDDRPAYREAIVAHLKGDTPRFEVDFRYRGASGELALVPPARRGGAARRRARLPHRRRDVATSPRRASATANWKPRRPRRRPPIARATRSARRPRMKSATRSRWNRSITACTTGTSKPTTSISRPTCAFCSASRPRCSRRPTTGASASIRPTSPMFRRRLVEHLKGETPRLVCDLRYLHRGRDLALGAPARHRVPRTRRPRASAWSAPPATSPRSSSASGSCRPRKTAAQRQLAVGRARHLDDIESRYALALESISQRCRRLRRQSRNRDGLSRRPSLQEVLGLPEYGPITALGRRRPSG